MDSCSGDHVLLSGDFNLPCIDWVTGEAVFVKKGSAEVQASAADLVQHLLFYNLKQYNTLLNSHKKTLDLIFSNFPVDIRSPFLAVVDEDKFHPSFTIDACDIVIPPLKVSVSKKNNFRKADYLAINEDLSNRNWTQIFGSMEAEQIINTFYDILTCLIKKHVPCVSVSGGHRYPVWYSRALINIIKEKKQNS